MVALAAEVAPSRNLARHMETGCPRAAYLAAMLLEKVANDPDADAHLRRHARELVEILDHDEEHPATLETAAAVQRFARALWREAMASGRRKGLHRLDAIVANADAVVCQSGCVSHSAYYRLKDACKELGKPCVFV